MSNLLTSRRDNWMADLAFETALGYYTPEELKLKYEIDPQRFSVIRASVTFKQAVNNYRRLIDEEGDQFRIKARRMASEVLDELFNIAANEESSAGDKIKAIDALCRYAGFDKQEGNSDAPQVTVQIANFADENPPAPVTIGDA